MDDGPIAIRDALCSASLDAIPWDDLAEIEILTTPDGPFAEDVFYLFRAKDGGSCLVAQGEVQLTGLLPLMQRLPGFDNEAVIRAMSSTDYARFLCWRK